eukprot:13503417-Ditylum_brightwellii.AAC.1
MSQFLSQSDYAFKEIVKKNPKFANMSDKQIAYSMQNHPKTAAMVSGIKALKESSSTRQFTYAQ